MRGTYSLPALFLLGTQVWAFAPPLSRTFQIKPNTVSTTQNVVDNSKYGRITNVALPKTDHMCPRARSTELFGIPKMFRWLTDQYPNINRRLNEGLSGDTVVDNFYLDMNGIIHPCTHGNSDEIVVLDETAMFKKIFGYVDRYVHLHVYQKMRFRVRIMELCRDFRRRSKQSRPNNGLNFIVQT